MPEPGKRTLVIGCGALGRELVAVVHHNGLDDAVRIRCLPPDLHNRPDRIPAAVEHLIRTEGQAYERIFVAYGDCGTGGRLDAVLADHGVERLPGAHCYQFYAGDAFSAIAAAEPGTFYLTDFLARNFERLVIAGMGLDRHPELMPFVFANYRRLVYLSQVDDAATLALARAAAERLDLAFEHVRTGYGALGTAIAGLGAGIAADGTPTSSPGTGAGVGARAIPSAGA